jgi:hypothetical protein
MTPATANFPPPVSADEMDNMAEDALRERYGRRHLVRFGRSGQRQGGIDGLDQEDPTLVWQTTLQQDRVKAKIDRDLAAMDREGHFHPEVFVLVLGIPRDATLQREIQKISGQRQIEGRCRVDVLFWEDVRQILVGSPALLAKHFSGFGADGSAELTDLELEQLQFAKTPDLHLRWREGHVTGIECESRKLEILNVGSCTVQILSVYLVWHVETSLSRQTLKVDLCDDVLAPNHTVGTTLTLRFREASDACAEAGLPRPKIIQEVPLTAKVVVSAMSRPNKVEKTFELDFERVANRGREESSSLSSPVAVRKHILDKCYRLYMADGPGSWAIWMREKSEDAAEIRAVVREAIWLRDHGLIEAIPGADMTIVQARLTTDGRDYFESSTNTTS